MQAYVNKIQNKGSKKSQFGQLQYKSNISNAK